MIACSMVFCVSADEVTYTDDSGQYKMSAICENNGNYKHAVTKTYNYTGVSKRVGARVKQRASLLGSDLTDTYNTGIISNNLSYSVGNNCLKSNNPWYSIHYSEWYNSQAYESGLAFTHTISRHVVY